MWERVKLDTNFEKAQAQINQELEHWPAFLQAKCKLRLAKTLEYLKRMRKLSKDEASQPILTVRAKKVLKREASREARAKKVAQLENVIERELVERLQKGVYGDIYNLPQNVFESVLSKHGSADRMDEEAIEEELEDEVEYVEEEELEEEEGAEVEYLGEDEFEMTEGEEEAVEDLEDIVTEPRPKRRGQHVEIEYENESAPKATSLRKR